MKDGPDGTLIQLVMKPTLDSLVVSAASGLPAEENVHETDRQVLAALRDHFSETGATVKQLQSITGMGDSTLYKARGRLLKTPWVRNVKRGGGSYLELVEGVELPWNPGTDSTPDSTPTLSALHAAPEHDSTPLHASSTPDSTPFHTSPSL